MNQQSTTEDKRTKRLYLSDTDRKLSGVCGGIAEYFGVDASVIRLAWVLVTILSGIVPGVIAYIVAAIIIPRARPQQ
jgi:phage shock protein PspC (stress-responsive transcriptional regulator)